MTSKRMLCPLAYADYRQMAASGDLLLCRPASAEGRLITAVTDSTFSHVSMVVWINAHRRDDPTASALMLVESLQHKGKRMVPLSEEIARYSGFYDVYRVHQSFPRLYGCAYDGEAAAAYMCRGVNTRYGWGNLVRVLCRRYLPRPFSALPPVRNDSDPRARRDCSAQVHAAMRMNFGPLLRQHDCDVVPNDFATDPRLHYLGTLYADSEAAQSAAKAVETERLHRLAMDASAALDEEDEAA